jgi:hypothetical protein
MARSSVKVDSKVYGWLSEIYSKRFGESATQLMDSLNQHFADDVSSRRTGSKNLISDRTIRDFFKNDNSEDSDSSSLSLPNINYLCLFMLGMSYEDAQAIESTQNPDILNRQRQTSKPQFHSTGQLISSVELDNFSVARTREIKPFSLPTLKECEWLPKYQESVRRSCETVRIPNMREPRRLEDVYVLTTLSKDLRTRKKKSITDLLQEMEGQFEEHYEVVTYESIFSDHLKLMIWGRAGAGKTTLLKNWIHSKTRSTDVLPFFISLPDYTKALQKKGSRLIDVMLNPIAQHFPNHQIAQKFLDATLNLGQACVALDGLDEVPKENLQGVQDNISNLVRQYPQSRYALTCRFGAVDYVPTDEFIEVEVADWNDEQIAQFVRQWFQASQEKDVVENFMAELKQSSVAVDVSRNPLMLTLLCQLYDDGYKFPRDQTELMEDSVDFYMRKWDSARRIQRDEELEKSFSRQQRRFLFAEVAYEGMTGAKTFWERWELEEKIEQFVMNISGTKASDLQNDTGEILRTLESEHGLITRVAKDTYGFSHRSFLEFFAAQELLTRFQQTEISFSEVVRKYALDRRWRTVLIMLVSRQKNAEPFLRQILKIMNELVHGNKSIQRWFKWLKDTTSKADVSSASWRACIAMFDLETPMHFQHDPQVDCSIAQRLAERLRAFNKIEKTFLKPTTPRIRLICYLAVVLTLADARAAGRQETEFKELTKIDPIYQSFQEDLASFFKTLITLSKEAELNEITPLLQELSNKLPQSTASQEVWAEWTDELRDVMENHLDEGRVNEVHEEDAKILDNYIYLASLLTDMVIGDSRCSPDARREIIESLFLPTS